VQDVRVVTDDRGTNDNGTLPEMRSFSDVLKHEAQVFMPGARLCGYQSMRGDGNLNDLMAASIFAEKKDSGFVRDRVASQQAPSEQGCMKMIELQLKMLWKEMLNKNAAKGEPFILDCTNLKNDELDKELDRLPAGSAVKFTINSALESPQNNEQMHLLLEKIHRLGLIPVFEVTNLDPDMPAPDMLSIARDFFKNGGAGYISVSFKDQFLKAQKMGFVFRVTKDQRSKEAAGTHMDVAARSVFSSPSLSGVVPLFNALKTVDLNIAAKNEASLNSPWRLEGADLSVYLQKIDVDPILGLAQRLKGMKLKVNAVVGVMSNKNGDIILPAAFQEAASDPRFLNRPIEPQPLLGHAGFRRAMTKLVFGDSCNKNTELRTATMQTWGGTGGLVLIAHSILQQRAQNGVMDKPILYLANHSWPNTEASFVKSGFEVVRRYSIFDQKEYKKLSWEDDLRAAPQGAYVVLDASCQNPSGLPRTAEEEERFIQICKERNLTIIVDNAYQGFGKGFNKDAGVMRSIIEKVGRGFFNNSLSKNANGYGYRQGLLVFVGKDRNEAAEWSRIFESATERLVGGTPEYFAALTAFVVEHEEYRSAWLRELEENRVDLDRQRKAFAAALIKVGFDSNTINKVIADGEGMFCLLPGLTEAGAKFFLDECGVAILQDGSNRCTIAAFKKDEDFEALTAAYLKMLAMDDNAQYFIEGWVKRLKKTA
jgi:aromatic-amino-acid transaminase